MKKIAFINQRYGLEVNGGSEYYTRLIAEQLNKKYDVHIITTKAIDYMTWQDYYVKDTEIINDVVVHRFSVDHPRIQEEFDKINALMLTDNNHKEEDENKWVEAQGPSSSKLINYIENSYDEYDVFFFVTYLYYNTVKGLPKVSDKAVLIPTAHDEPYIYFDIYNRIFSLPKAFVFLTDEEKAFVQNKFKNYNINNETMAVGIDVPDNINKERFYNKIGIEKYIIYVGRIDEGKGCHWLFKYFAEYKKRNDNDLKLVLMGKSVIDVPDSPDIINMGFVSEEDKYDGIAGAKALVLPSQFESLSISALEAMSVETPVIMNGKCDVLKGHCIKSNAGLYYDNFFEFEGCINYMLNNNEQYEIMKKNGKKYIDNYYSWDVILNKFDRIIEMI